jgi:hypothetical protein
MATKPQKIDIKQVRQFLADRNEDLSPNSVRLGMIDMSKRLYRSRSFGALRLLRMTGIFKVR